MAIIKMSGRAKLMPNIARKVANAQGDQCRKQLSKPKKLTISQRIAIFILKCMGCNLR